MGPVFGEGRLDLEPFGDLMDQRRGVVADEASAASSAGGRLAQVKASRAFPGGTKARWALRCLG